MNTKPTVNQVIENQLDSFASILENQVNGDVLAFIGPILNTVDDRIREAVEYKRSLTNQQNPKLTVLLETTGGIIEVTQRIVETFRHHYDEVDFIIPSHAMSAGTVLALSGDAILMDYYSVLGPIDPQVPKNGHMLPALGYLEAYNRLIERSRAGEITAAEITYLVQSFDAAELYRYEQAKNLTITLLEEWLVNYKFKNWTTTETRNVPVTDEMRKTRAREIAEDLNNTEDWHSHGRGISMEVLRNKLRLHIDDFGENENLNEAIRSYHDLLSHNMSFQGQKGIVHVTNKYTTIF